ncbi:galactose-1-phosphate uridylyltransferase [Corynebacterium atypicum]|uniref:galactose-1-phosphate uridylyltransferase n=1 Tax=Corynebacterium atypicum TaxID=191610 RepID=UPI000690A4A9|nr:galactose-1-phosphate uridylyltransferase [Corynebacterium atypicum]
MRVTRTRLSDGRELIYFDLPGAPERTAPDERGLEATRTESVLRRDPLTGERVIFAAHRQNRTFLPPANQDPLAPTLPGSHPSEVPEQDYQVVVFENRFPSLSMAVPDVAETVDGEALMAQAAARARCEVVCFTPDAAGSFAQLDLERKRLVIDVWAHRTAELAGLAGVEYVFAFENRGEEIGVTLHHPHGQIYSYPFVPPRASAIAARAREFRDTHAGEDLFDAYLDAERRAGTRMIAQTEHFSVLTPVAARWPVEVMVMARRPVGNFAELTDDERADLACVLDRLFPLVDQYFPGIAKTPYIAAWNQAPVAAPRDGRLHLQLFSLMRSAGRMKFLAGSESGMGVWINDATPEAIAARFRELWGEGAWPVDDVEAAR